VPAGEPEAEAQRVDAFVAAALPAGTSRGRVAAAIRGGLLRVNGSAVTKPAYTARAPRGSSCRAHASQVRPGDRLHLSLPPPPATEALPEALPLDVVFEDGQVLVVNKASHVVVHPSAGHASGTLVNAFLHHVSLPGAEVDSGEEEAGEGDESSADFLGTAAAASLRPGIVHRLDKGTSGLLVIAKTARAQASLSAQFAARSVRRRYLALHVGAPPRGEAEGRVEAPIGRDASNRLRMAVVWAPGAPGARAAASRWALLEPLARGGAALLAWRLETGRTHQVRVHAKQLGLPLLNDPLYGGTAAAAAAALARAGAARAEAAALLAGLPGERPLLHAAELGFEHPTSREPMSFSVPPPADFEAALAGLRGL